MEQQPAAESIVHELSKPVTRVVAWGAALLALVALAEGGRRNLAGP